MMSNLPIDPFVLALDDAAATLDMVGGKGASLARLAAAGLPVPSGFHVTTTAYRHFVTVHGLQAQILAAAAAVKAEQPTTLAEASRQIGVLFAKHELPQEIVTAVRQAYDALNAEALVGKDVAVAVRSSATAEDLPDLSFAGQQESYLNLRGEAMLFEAIKRCWASLWTARAISYRARHAIAADDVSLAVVIQTLVPATAAGILFTANPLTGARTQVVINAAWGLGEAVVSGQVTPDTLVVDRASGAIIEQTINEKTVMTVRTATGTQETSVPVEQRRQAVLTPAQGAELARMGMTVEALYGQPMDIEWALHNDRFFILQARPITTLHTQLPLETRLPEELPEELSEGLTEVWNDSLLGDYLWTSSNVGEAVPDVMTPCTWSLVQIFIANTMAIPIVGGHRMIGNIGGRFYMNLSLLATLNASFGLGQQRFSEATEQVFGHLPTGIKIPLMPLSRWRVVRDVLPVAIRMRRRVASNQKKLPAFIAAAPAQADALRATIANTANIQALRDLWHDEVLPILLRVAIC